MRKSFIIFATMIALVPAVAMATNYECNTEEVVLWKKGHLVPQTAKTFGPIHEVIHFNDENGELWAALNSSGDVPFNRMPFRILQKMESGKELFAVYNSKDDDYAAGSSFRLRGYDKDTGLVFLFDSTSSKSISTGKCHIYEGVFPY